MFKKGDKVKVVTLEQKEQRFFVTPEMEKWFSDDPERVYEVTMVNGNIELDRGYFYEQHMIKHVEQSEDEKFRSQLLN